ncbi:MULTISPECIES: MBL fold metallo-hydrolase [unclassified Paraflavitalea]|uniref:MBL fold metallo-hydrolase n=1 Tax=unclassified Paraflavitalea TaxID=2798305 RepID=UPI003D349F22
MNRRLFLRSGLLTAGALTLAKQELIANLFQQPAWKIQMLTENIGVFTERGGTILFNFTADGIVVVDSQFPDQSNHLIEELKKRNQGFALLVNTHHHGDHTGGNISYKGLVKHVLAHENSLVNQKAAAAAQKSEDKQLYPDRTYRETWCEDIGGERMCLYYFGAGHTNGDSVVHFEDSNIAHMGDLCFNRRHPFVDRSAGANMKNWITVLEKTKKKLDKKTRYVFGHSAEGYQILGTHEDLSKFGEYLNGVLDFTDKEIKAGKTKEEFIKTTTLPFKTEWSGDGLARPLTAAWDELTAPK